MDQKFIDDLKKSIQEMAEKAYPTKPNHERNIACYKYAIGVAEKFIRHIDEHQMGIDEAKAHIQGFIDFANENMAVEQANLIANPPTP